MADDQHEKMASAIEKLLLDDSGIQKVAMRLGGFNIFEAIGHTRSEKRHSDFLAFLLDPNETHGLGTEFLTRFVVEIVKSMRPDSRPLSLTEITLANFDGCLVLREYHRIDVLCIDEAHQFLLAVENKVGAVEQPGQLEDYRLFLEDQYREFRRVLAYLTPDTGEPSDKYWTPVGYSHVLSIVDSLTAKHSETLGDAVTISLNHYAQMLRRNIVTDNDLVDIARAVYRKHKAALDFIFEQRPDDQLAISEFAVELASNDNRIEVVRPTKSTIRFFPTAWEGIPTFNATSIDEWTQTGHSLLFEIKNKPSFVRMTIVIGPIEDSSLRREILDFSNDSQGLLTGDPNRYAGEFTQIYSRPMVDRHTLETQHIEDIKLRFKSEFRSFMDNEFEGIVDALAQAFS